MPTFPREIPEVSVADVAADAYLLDVREPDEWHAGHAPHAHHVPMQQIPQQLDSLPKDQQLVVVCRSGGRSAQVTGYLVAHGLSAVNMAGGMQEWERRGNAVVADHDRPAFVA